MPPVPARVIEPATLTTKNASAGPLRINDALLRLMFPVTLTTLSPETPLTVVVEVMLPKVKLGLSAAALMLALIASVRAGARFWLVKTVPFTVPGPENEPPESTKTLPMIVEDAWFVTVAPEATPTSPVIVSFERLTDCVGPGLLSAKTANPAAAPRFG